jgi:hypothetical protein
MATFSIQYELVIRAMTFAVMMTAWIFARFAFGQPVLHPWLGAMTAGLLAAVGGCLVAIPGVGPLPEAIAYTGILVMGMLFSTGLYVEAYRVRVDKRIYVLMLVAGLAGSILLELLVAPTLFRALLLRFIVSTEIASSLLWLPRLLQTTPYRFGPIIMGVFALLSITNRFIPLVQYLRGGLAGHSILLPYVTQTDLFFITAGCSTFILYSAEVAIRSRTKRSSGARST